jgi:ribosomal protein S21|tara:strand:- start:260 stop:457 length:198 start_codon:yes stop_codon:yes gene_type:complete
MAIYVKVIDNKIEWALRKFKKKVKEAGILHEVQQRQFYEKPSAIKRDRRAKGRLRAQIRSKKAEL